jgi:hypothetical protein
MEEKKNVCCWKEEEGGNKRYELVILLTGCCKYMSTRKYNKTGFRQKLLHDILHFIGMLRH